MLKINSQIVASYSFKFWKFMNKRPNLFQLLQDIWEAGRIILVVDKLDQQFSWVESIIIAEELYIRHF